jgi:hypothetical protein
LIRARPLLKTFPFITFAVLVVGFATMATLWLRHYQGPIVRSDGIGYSAYLRLYVVHHSLDFSQLRTLEQPYGVARAPRTGRLASQYAVGTAIAEFPFFLAAHMVAKLWKWPQDGWSVPYQWSILVASLFWCWTGLAATWTFVARCTAPRAASFAVIAAVFGTNLLHYAVSEPSMSHIYAFSVVALMLLLGDLFWSRPCAGRAIIFGVAVGFLFSIRQYDILYAPLALYPVLWRANRSHVAAYGLVVVAGASAAALPHFLAVTYYLGVPWANTYWMAGPLNWMHPELALVLFSVRKGWFFWTPVAAIGVLGLVLGLKSKLRWFCALGLCGLAGLAYLISVWADPPMGISFGHRAFVDAVPVLAVGLALMSPYPLTKVIVPLCIALNLYLTWAYWNDYIPGDETQWRTYVRVVQMPFRTAFDGGPAEKDSSKADGLAAEVKILGVHREADWLVVTAKAKNTGSARWLSDMGRGGVLMAVRPFEGPECHGGPAFWEWRERIPTDMAPSEEAVLTVRIPISRFTQPFRYVCAEMLSSSVAWFRDLGSRPDPFSVSARMIRMTEITEKDALERLRQFIGRREPILHLDFESLTQGRFPDRSGNHFDAFVEGTITPVPGGVSGRAAKFDGASWLEVDESGGFSAPDMTVSLWAKPATLRGRRGLASKRSGNSAVPWVIVQNGGAVAFEATEVDGVTWSFNFQGPPVLQEHAWTHVATVMRQGFGVTLYINGRATAEKKNAGHRTLQNQALLLGKELWGGDPPLADTPGFYIGLLDEVKVWARALSAEEVMTEFKEHQP